MLEQTKNKAKNRNIILDHIRRLRDFAQHRSRRERPRCVGTRRSTMSTETHVFFRGKLPTKAALSRAMKELGFPFAIKPATGSLEQQSGFMPMTLRREETGVEFDVFNDRS